MSAHIEQRLADALRPLTQNPERAGVFCDIDGTIAPIVGRPDAARVPDEVSRLLGRLGHDYGAVACVSGRSVAEARRLVGVGAIAYVGSHGAEVLLAGAQRPKVADAFASWEGRVREFVGRHEHERGVKRLRIRLEDKGPIKAFHWRGSPDEEGAETLLKGVAAEAEEQGLNIHWGRKVLEIRPPVPIDKGQGVRTLIEERPVRNAMYGGDDVTDLDAFDALDALTASGELDAAVRVGVRSPEGPQEIVDRADLVVEGERGFTEVLSALADAAGEAT